MTPDLNNAAPLLKIDNATVQKSGVKILENIDIEIPEGQHTAIIGPNGSGKSTLIKLITRHIYPLANADGKPIITIFGRAMWNVFELRNLLGIVSPELHTAFTAAPNITGLNAVLSGYFASQGVLNDQKITPQMRHEAAQALQEMGASHLENKPMEIMSAGEARRVLIARALVHHPRALLLDEPTAGLDIAGRRNFLETLRNIAAKGCTLLVVTHHIDEIIPEIDRIILMKDGKVHSDGSKKTVLNSSSLSKIFGMEIELRSAAGGYFSADLSTNR